MTEGKERREGQGDGTACGAEPRGRRQDRHPFAGGAGGRMLKVNITASSVLALWRAIGLNVLNRRVGCVGRGLPG